MEELPGHNVVCVHLRIREFILILLKEVQRIEDRLFHLFDLGHIHIGLLALFKDIFDGLFPGDPPLCVGP